jgi:hypothetical protein
MKSRSFGRFQAPSQPGGPARSPAHVSVPKSLRAIFSAPAGEERPHMTHAVATPAFDLQSRRKGKNVDQRADHGGRDGSRH